MVKGKSDPYVKINIGGETFTSQVIKNNLNPTWNEMYEVNNYKHSYSFCVDLLGMSRRISHWSVTGIIHQVILTELPGQELHVEVFDKDMDMKDDFMGRYSSFLISKIIHGRTKNESLTLFIFTMTLINIQAEGESEGDYWLAVHRPGGFPLLKATSACFGWKQSTNTMIVHSYAVV